MNLAQFIREVQGRFADQGTKTSAVLAALASVYYRAARPVTHLTYHRHVAALKRLIEAGPVPGSMYGDDDALHAMCDAAAMTAIGAFTVSRRHHGFRG